MTSTAARATRGQDVDLRMTPPKVFGRRSLGVRVAVDNSLKADADISLWKYRRRSAHVC
jgi:hypothetical protein